VTGKPVEGPRALRRLSAVRARLAMPREKIILACNECKNRNYFTTKNKRLHPERVEWKKHCPRCNKHLLHKETK
jgi:large subunit ribosomal protein L33